MATKKHELQPNKWVDQHADYLYRYAATRISDDEMAKDLVQETFLSALKAMKNFKGKASERTWLTSIIKRKVIDHYRKINSEKGKAEIKVSFYESGDREGEWLEERVPQQWGDAADAAIESKELQKVIDWCIENLPEKYAVVFKMKTIQKIETEEICNDLEITTSNLWVLIHRARTQLQKCLTDNWFSQGESPNYGMA